MPEKFTRAEMVHRNFVVKLSTKLKLLSRLCKRRLARVEKIYTLLSLSIVTYFYRSYQGDNVKTDVSTCSSKFETASF